jgi:hypothetical protein
MEREGGLLISVQLIGGVSIFRIASGEVLFGRFLRVFPEWELLPYPARCRSLMREWN